MYQFLTKLLIFLLDLVFPKSRKFKVQKPGRGIYLHRWYLWRDRRGDVMLHCIARDDDDPDPHDHPWDFQTTVLAGGYADQRWSFEETGPNGAGIRRFEGYEFMRPGETVRRRADHTHRVILNGDKLGRAVPAWTLVKTGAYGAVRDWNFVTKDRRVPWREYLGVPEEKDR